MEPQQLKILYAEDNRITAQETTEALEENGYKVQTVYDGNEAWLAFQASAPDVVLLDYQMPGKTGLEVYQLIRQQNSTVPVLILSSYTELCAASLKMGTSDFIRKDSGIDETCARIEAAWQRRPQNDVPTKGKAYRLSPHTIFHSSASLLEYNDKRLPLKHMHAEILTLLCQNLNIPVPASLICKKLWNNNDISKIPLLRDYISDLRKIVEKDKNIQLQNQYGKGYCLVSLSNLS